MSRQPLCAYCGRRIEAGVPQRRHHLLGHALCPAVVVQLHVPCHVAVHRALRACGVDLQDIIEAPSHERVRVAVHGIAVLLEAATPTGIERACVRRAVARLDERLTAGSYTDTDAPAPAVPIPVAGGRV